MNLCSVNRVDQHNHHPDNKAAGRGVVLKKIREKIATDPTVPVRRVFDKVVDEEICSDSDELPNWEGLRTRAKRMRSKFMPPLPATIDDVDINGPWAETWKSQRFLSHIDNDWGIVVFTTNRMITALQRCDTLFIDGTFRTAPFPYMQFVTIHGLYHGHVIPLVFALLTNKTVGLYRQLFSHLKRYTRRVTGRALRPVNIVLDFEQAILLAVETELPGTRLSGCYFHFTQSLWRKLQNLGLAGIYRRDPQVRATIRKVMAIGFLPVLLVRQNFTMLQGSRRTRRFSRRYPAFQRWLSYVETTYIGNRVLFPPPIWNVFTRGMDTRTINHLEGTHLSVSVKE